MERVAVYLAPAPGSALMRSACAWLGSDPDAGRESPPLTGTGIEPSRLAAITAAPRWYGFHATLKAPFRLREERSLGELRSALADHASSCTAFDLPLKIGSLGGFLALVPAGDSSPLHRLADDCVRLFDPFRAPLTAADRARRRPERLSQAEVANLDRWGYPHVMAEFRFHMTLTDRLPEPEHGAIRAILERRFAPLLSEPMPVDGLALFGQPAGDAPFQVLARFAFGRPR